MTIEEIIDYITNNLDEIEKKQCAFTTEIVNANYAYRCGLKEAYFDMLEIIKDHQIALAPLVCSPIETTDSYPTEILTSEEIEEIKNANCKSKRRI